MADLEKLAEELSGLTLLEAAQLKEMLEERWGVTAAAPMAVMAAGVPGTAAADLGEEQIEFDVVIADVGPKKIEVIKTVRQMTNLGLKEAKDLVEGAPSVVLEAVPKDMANDAKGKLEAAGATIEIN